MKHFLLGLAICSSLTIAKAQDAPNPVIERVAPATQSGLIGAFDWKLRLQPGQKWKIRTFMRVTQNQGLPAELQTKSQSKMPSHMEVNSQQRINMDYEVLSLDSYGAATVRITYGDISSSISMIKDGKPLAYLGSASPSFVFKALNGASFTIKQAPDGKVWAVYGIEALQERLLNGMTHMTPALKATMKSIASQFASAKFFRGVIKGSDGSLPTYPVRVGDSWDYDASLPQELPFRVSLHVQRTLKARKDGVAFIQDEVTFGKGSFAINAGKTGVSLTNYQGVSQGTSQIDEATGLSLSVTSTQKLSGTVEIQMPAMPKQANGNKSHKLQSTFSMVGETHAVMEREN